MAIAISRSVGEKKILEINRMESISALTTKPKSNFLVTGSSATVAIMGFGAFTYTPPSEDTDIITNKSSLDALVRMFRSSEPRIVNLIDRIKENGHSMAGVGYPIQKSSPFVHYMVNGLESFDFFRKSVGAIPFGERELEDYCSVQVQSGMQNYEIRTASKPFLTATYINPVAITEIRSKRAGLMILKASEEFENVERFTNGFVAPAVDYVMQGEKVIGQMLERIKGSATYRHVFSNDDYVKYAKKARRNVPNAMDNITNKILRLADALQVGKGKEENREALNTFINNMRG